MVTGSAVANRETSSSYSQDFPPSVSSPTSKFLGVLNTEWDTYQDRRNGRVFFYHSYSGNSQWKPPRQSSSVPAIPKAKESGFIYDSQVSEKSEDPGDELKTPIKSTDSYVRDSIRKSDQSDIEIPTGYVEIYEKSTGFISYFDPMSETVWQTALDQDQKLYFFTECGKSVWTLPTMRTSMIDPNLQNHSKPPKLLIIRTGWLGYKGSYGPTPSNKKPKWCQYFAVLVDAHLLLFGDKSSYEHIWIPTITGKLLKTNNRGGNSAKSDNKQTCNEILHASVDLSHCLLSWGKIHKTNFFLELQSDFDKNFSKTKLRFDKSDEANNWFQDLSRFVKETVTNAGTPHLTRKQSARDRPASHSVPASPLFSSRGGAANRQSIQHLSSNIVKETKGSSLGLKASFRGTREKIGEIWNRSNKVNPAQTDSANVADSDSLCINPGNADPPKSVKLKREGSFLSTLLKPKKMDDDVKLRVKKTQLERTPSKQRKIKYLTAFIGNSRDSKRQSRESLVERGIIKPASVFGNSLSKMKPDPATGLPEFLVRATQRIEEFADTVGLYRINGDAAIVQKIRLEIDNDNYSKFDETNDVTLLASSLKLFFRELPSFIITKDVCLAISPHIETRDKATLIPIIQKAIECGGLDMTAQKVLAHLMAHLNRLSKMPENKMDAKNLSVVFSPNLVENTVGERKHESIMSEMYLNNMIVELMITHAPDIFAYIHK